MKELVRCRPCGYVIEADKLGDVCPACGMPRKVFEPYRERVSRKRLMLLNFDLHPIAIHLSQALVMAIPVLIIFENLFKQLQPELLKNVIMFSVFIFPFTLILAIITGIIDGLTRFKTLATPILRVKIIFSTIILILSVALLIAAQKENLYPLTLTLSLLTFGAGFRLGLWGKQLINVILPGSYPQKRGTKAVQPETEKA
jgi:rubredoxin